jgi:hypothetical protein
MAVRTATNTWILTPQRWRRKPPGALLGEGDRRSRPRSRAARATASSPLQSRVTGGRKRECDRGAPQTQRWSRTIAAESGAAHTDSPGASLFGWVRLFWSDLETPGLIVINLLQIARLFGPRRSLLHRQELVVSERSCDVRARFRPLKVCTAPLRSRKQGPHAAWSPESPANPGVPAFRRHSRRAAPFSGLALAVRACASKQWRDGDHGAVRPDIGVAVKSIDPRGDSETVGSRHKQRCRLRFEVVAFRLVLAAERHRG